MFVEEFIEKIENPSPRSKWETRKVAKFRCDFCNEEFLVRKNIKRRMAQKYVFCDKTCSTKARKSGGILQQLYEQNNIKKYGVKHFSQRSDVIKKRKRTFVEKYGVENPSILEFVKEKKKKTSLKNWGVDNPNKSKAVRKKTKQTNIKKYGALNPMQNKKIQKKIIKTNLEKFGVENPFQSEEIKEKIKKYWLDNYGVEHNSQTEEYKEAYKKTSLARFGVEHASQSHKIKEKKKKTILKKYGVEHFGMINARFRLANENVNLHNWYSGLPEPKPSYTVLLYYLIKSNVDPSSINKNFVKEFIANYSANKSSLEVLAEGLFGIEHYNKSPKQVKTLCRPDFKLNDKIYLNVDGLYWHSAACSSNKNRHFTLRKDFEKAGLRLFQFREDEIKNKPQIIKSIVNNALGRNQSKVYARKCKIKKVKHKEAAQFLNQNHLMGSTNAKHLGLFCKDELISILSWKCRKDVCKIERFCSKINTSVIGGFSKLLSHLEKHCLYPETNQIHNWVDLRYGTRDHLANKGFILEKETLGWKWTDFYKTFNRLQCRANMDERGLSMNEHAVELGWFKIYDAGQRLWIKKL